MTAIKEHAIELINGLPDEKIYYLVNIINAIGSNESDISESLEAYQELQKFRKKRRHRSGLQRRTLFRSR